MAREIQEQEEKLNNELLGSPVSNHLQGLTEEQLNGFHTFREWMAGPENFSVLQGVGGSGKTYSVAHWLKQLEILPSQVIAIAPTNKAVQALEGSFDRAEFPCHCATIHKALGWSPQSMDWGRDDELELLKLVQEKIQHEEDFNFKEIKTRIDPKINLLNRIKENVRKQKLTFAPGPNAATEEDYAHLKIAIVDECSMISREVYEALILTFRKILFMGDDEQIFPVGEGLSKSFENEKIASFMKIKRCDGSLKKFNEMLRGRDVNTMRSICLGVDSSRSEIADNNVCKMAKPDAFELAKGWLKSLSWDGSEFRLLFFKNETIENFQVFAKQMVGEDWEVGDIVTANKPIQRWCGAARNKSALITDETSEILSIDSSAYAAIQTEQGREHIRVSRGVVSAPSFDQNGFVLSSPFQHYKKEWISSGRSGELLVNLVSFEDFKLYRQILKNWDSIRSVFYSKAKKLSNDTDGAKLLFQVLGIESWTQVPGTPNYSRFTVKDLRDLPGASFLEFDKIKPPQTKNRAYTSDSPVDFFWLQRAVNAYYFWIKGLHDPIRLKISSTVHKSQGETIERVLMHLPEIYESRKYGPEAPENARRLIYTAASRTSKQLYIIA